MSNGDWEKIGVLWKKEKGMSGELQLEEDGAKIRIWVSKNRYKSKDNHPVAYIYRMPTRQRPKKEQPQPEPQQEQGDEIPF
jgi:hypothetical protein